MDEKIVKSEDEWKKVLSPEAYNVLRKKGTERPFTGSTMIKKKMALTSVPPVEMSYFYPKQNMIPEQAGLVSMLPSQKRM